ncbi:hypothetical protein [Boseongicola aestuarii]|jgi:hypothetical protein|uniref:Uncharacterized protein n=1 Tax=Boseongicola aestuarii TaxID=1470561 RepID=A0A238J349_9RHOB|nr:hypothetical protein [Boseongicola aestuarii]SMX24334.1 hypothetical protein BOA8489_02458 [Boseongicola aestuarii]
MYIAFAFLQIGMATACLFFVTSSTVKPMWSSIAFILTGLVFFGNGLRVALDMFGSDFAFYLHSMVFPYASGAMVALLFVTGSILAYRALSGGKL